MYYFAYYFFLAIAVVYVIVRSFRLVRRYRKLGGVVLLVLLGALLFHFLVIGFGGVISGSTALLVLNKLRILLQSLLSPLLIIVAMGIAQRFNTPIINKKRIIITVWIFAVLMIALGIRFYLSCQMGAVSYYKHLRFEPVAQQELYLISATIGFILLFISLLVYSEQQYSLLFGIVLVVLVGFALLRLFTESKIYLVNDMLDFILLAGLYKAYKDSLVISDKLAKPGKTEDMEEHREQNN